MFDFEVQWFGGGLNWYDAREACREWGGDLASIHNQEVNDFLRDIAHEEGWIGVNDQQNENVWVWSDETDYDYKGWSSWEPNDWGGNEDCGVMKRDGEWNDLNCEATHPGYFCMKFFEEEVEEEEIIVSTSIDAAGTVDPAPTLDISAPSMPISTNISGAGTVGPAPVLEIPTLDLPVEQPVEEEEEVHHGDTDFEVIPAEEGLNWWEAK